MEMSPGRRPSQGILPPSVSTTPTRRINPPTRIRVLPRSDMVSLASEQLALVATPGPSDAEVPICAQRRHPTSGGTLKIAFLEQIGLVHVFDRALFLADGGGDGF